MTVWAIFILFYTASSGKSYTAYSGALQSFKVIEGYQMWYQLKAFTQFPISLSLYLAE